MVTVVSVFIEQVGSMIKGIPKLNKSINASHNSIQLQRATRDTCLLKCMPVHMHPSAGYYLVLNRTIAGRWMHEYELEKYLCKIFEAR